MRNYIIFVLSFFIINFSYSMLSPKREFARFFRKPSTILRVIKAKLKGDKEVSVSIFSKGNNKKSVGPMTFDGNLEAKLDYQLTSEDEIQVVGADGLILPYVPSGMHSKVDLILENHGSKIVTPDGKVIKQSETNS